jgi:pyrrolidone-carboxylate peptidase
VTHIGGTGVNAVVWIEPGRALVVRGGDGGEHATIELPVPHAPTATTPALADIARRIGEVDRVLVLGTDDLRTALEREIVAIGQRPETIRDVANEGPVDEAGLVARLHRLA